MNVSFYIAKRYFFSKSSNTAINIITWIASVGVIAGALSLFVVLSAFAGLKEFSLSFTNKFDPDLKVMPASGKFFTVDSLQKSKIEANKDIKMYSEVIEERVLLSFKSKNTPAYIKGVDSTYSGISDIENAVFLGQWLEDNAYQVVLGNDLSRKLSAGVRDYSGLLSLYVPKPGKGQILNVKEAFRTANATVVGIYSINEELDNKFAFTDIGFARDLLQLHTNEVSALEVNLSPSADLNSVRKELEAVFGQNIVVKDRIQLNDSLYKMLNTENLAVYLIFTLVIIIALFNVIGSIIMAVLEKRQNSKTLLNLGLTKTEVQRIFFFQGGLMSVAGGIVGLVLGILLIFSQLYFEWIMITPSLAYPVKLEFINIGIVFLTISGLGFLASYISSKSVKRSFR
ncbi:ABC transporter permease [Psychroflexus sediminis]|uniref:Lipoprotein-releasing system permease protein n=1 Tax=Psychroflexus sediminis TaxID=470826 RepID=A0A1G7TXF9_9FLAO|nr:ABC transporter permease [Psychroflexus sediminis]SDG39942.1 lipoprotein-releasing system permease protein [Psychroflexus sediminis]